MKRLIAAVLTVGVVTLGTAGVAAAQQTGGSTSPSTSTQPPSSSGSNAKAGRARTARAALRIVATTLGLSPKELVSGLCGGQTLAQLASQHGKSASDLTSALVTAADARIAKNESAGKITASQAATRKSAASARISKLVNSYQPSAQRCMRVQGAGSSTTPTTSS